MGKTTTAVNLGIGLAMQGKKVLLVDADLQGDLTTCLGWQDTDELPVTISNKLLSVIIDKNENPYDGILRHEEGVDLVPSNLELSSMKMSLVTAMCREMVMKNYLNEIKDSYDYVLIDCMPSLGMITLNALTAADSVIVPVQAQYLPAKGMTQLLTTISNVKRHSNPQLNIDGILLTLVDGRTNLAKSTVDALWEQFGSHIRIYRTTIPIVEYGTYQQNDYKGEVPTLQDFRNELLKQEEPEAKKIALAIELFTNGSLNTFAKHTNVDTNNRLICYDILDLGKQLMPIGMLVVLDSILNRITQNVSDLQMSYITNVEAGHGLIKVGSSLVPFANKFSKNTKLYKLMTIKPGESA